MPEVAVETRAARRLLPTSVPHADAAADAGRAALLVHAIAEAPHLLHAGTQDWLHQRYREPAMPEAYALMARLRAAGFAAAISGAGPSVVVLGTEADLSGLEAAEPGTRFRRLGIGATRARVVSVATVSSGHDSASLNVFDTAGALSGLAAAGSESTRRTGRAAPPRWRDANRVKHCVTSRSHNAPPTGSRLREGLTHHRPR